MRFSQPLSITKKNILSATLIATVFLTACASPVVKESDRDITGLYDGEWIMKVAKGANVQYIENWNFSCDLPAYISDLEVRDGIVSVRPLENSDRRFETYINDHGRFSLELNLDGGAESTSASATTLADGRSRLIIRGDLGKSRASGRLIFGIKQFGWQGCQTTIAYSRKELSV